MFLAALVSAALSALLCTGAVRVRTSVGLFTVSGVAATGGLAVAIAWWASLALAGFPLGVRATAGIALAMLPLLAVGVQDLRHALRPLPQFLAQFATAACAVILGGISARFVTNPFGGLLSLTQWEVWGIAAPGAVLTILWIVLLMNAVNFLDGMDGLAAAVSGIGFVTIGVVSLLPQVGEPGVALPAFLAAGAVAGFLFWNLPPARLYLGTPGAWFLGFLLAVLSVQGSSKIATLAVVGAIPLLDGLSVVVARLRRGTSPLRGDTTHLHHLLADRGWAPQDILALYTVSSILLSLAAVLLPTPIKIVLLVASSAAILLFSLGRGPRVATNPSH